MEEELIRAPPESSFNGKSLVLPSMGSAEFRTELGDDRQDDVARIAYHPGVGSALYFWRLDEVLALISGTVERMWRMRI
jgi:hypothetical protein